jgi:hypothetical protein
MRIPPFIYDKRLMSPERRCVDVKEQAHIRHHTTKPKVTIAGDVHYKGSRYLSCYMHVGNAATYGGSNVVIHYN